MFLPILLPTIKQGCLTLPHSRKSFLFVMSLVAFCVPFSSHAFDLSIPVDCDYGKSCIIASYVDTNPIDGEAPQDYRCGDLTYEGSTATRFMIKDVQEMKKGVSVLAAEDGEVIAVRDGMNDMSTDLAGISSVQGRECGNGVIIQHRRSFVTEYCHMQKNSIIVEVGDKVRKGLRIGLAGLSGYASYPQLEFRVRRNGEFFDPFSGDEQLRCGSLKAYPLWDRKSQKKLSYVRTALLNAHFIDQVPFAIGAREGKFRLKEMSSTSDKLVFWADIFGIMAGDVLTMQLLSPNGNIIKEEIRQFKESKDRHFQFIGKVAGGKKWQLGEYEGYVELVRSGGHVSEGEVILDRRFYLAVTP